MRGSLSFASLLLVSGVAVAGEPTVAEATPAAPAAQQAPAPLAARWTVERRGDELVVRLLVENTGDTRASVVVAYGANPGAWLDTGEATGLDPIRTPAQEDELMSRSGPMPTWASVAAHGTREVGTWRFRVTGALPPTLHLRATVSTAGGDVELAWDGAPGQKTT